VGANFRLDALQAALLSVKLPHYQEYTDQRRANANYYTEQLSRLSCATVPDPSGCKFRISNPEHSASLSRTSGSSAWLIYPVAYSHNDHIWNQYTLRIAEDEQRDVLKNFLAKRGIGTEIYYPVPLHRQECFANLATEPAPLPNADLLAKQSISIPVYPELSRSQRDEVVDSIAAFQESRKH